MQRAIRIMLNVATTAAVVMTGILPVMAGTMTFDDESLHTSSVPVTATVWDYVDYKKVVVKNENAGIKDIVWNDDETIVRDVIANTEDKTAADNLAMRQLRTAYITGRITVDNLSDRSVDANFGAIFDEIRNFSARNYLNMELDCIVSPTADHLSDNGSHTVTVRHVSEVLKDASGCEIDLNISLKQPFTYDRDRYRIDSVKAIQAYGDPVEYVQLDETENKCIYNASDDSISLKLSRISPIVILADFHALWTDEQYKVIYHDRDGGTFWTQTLLGANIASDRIQPAGYPEWNDSRYFHDFKEWKCSRDVETAWNEYVRGGKKNKDLLHIDYQPVYEDPVDKIVMTFMLPDRTPAADTIISRPGTVALPVQPLDPKLGAEYTGRFIGWKSKKTGKIYSAGELMQVRNADDSDEYTAEYEKWTIRSYEFRDYDGRLIYKEQKKENEAIIIPANPTRRETEDYAYEFTGWSSPVVDENGTVIYTALYRQIQKFLVTFMDSDKKTILQQKRYKLGDMPYCQEPSKKGYIFTGWSSKDGVHPVTADAVYYATYRKNTAKEEKDNDDKKNSDDSGGGSSSDGGGGYWVNVMFRDWDGRAVKQVTVPQGSKLDPPVMSSFTLGGYLFQFIGWEPGQPGTVPYDGYAHDYDTYRAKYLATPVNGSSSSAQTGSNTVSKSTGNSKGSSGSAGSSGTVKPSSTSSTSGSDTARITPTPTPSITPSPWELNWHRTKMSQDEARIRFIPHEYYGNETILFDKDLSPEEKKEVEETVKEKQEEQEKKLQETSARQRTDSDEVKEFPEPKEEKSGKWTILIWIIGIVLLIIIAIFVIHRLTSKNDDMYY